MASTTHVADTTEPTIRRLAEAVGYTGRKIRIRVAETHTLIDDGWQEGSRSTYTLVRLADMEVLGVPEGEYRGALPLGIVALERSTFCGKDAGLVIHAGPETINPAALPAAAELTEDERKVLTATRTYKSSYGGDPHYRRTQSGLSVEAWDAAKASLTARGLLDRRGAITAAGRNAVSR